MASAIDFKYRITSILIFLASFMIACDDDPCLKGSGDASSESRNISEDISQLVIHDKIDVKVYIDGENNVKISGGSNVISFVKTEEDGNTLTIKDENSCTFLRDFDSDLEVEIHLTSLTAIEYNGSGRIDVMDTIKTASFNFESEEGTGSVYLNVKSNELYALMTNELIDMHISGQSNFAKISYNKTGWFYGSELELSTAEIYSASTGDIIVNARDSIFCSIAGLGNIQYIGQPGIRINEKSGKGEVLPYSD